MGRDAQIGQRAVELAVCPHTHSARAPLHEEENSYVTIRQSCWQKCSESIARAEGGETSLGPRRQGRQGHQSRAGDRHRSFRSAQAWRQGPQEKIVARLRFDSAKKGVNPNQVFAPARSRKQTIAPLKGCQFFAMFRAPFYSKDKKSRFARNSMKTNDRGFRYPKMKRGVLRAFLLSIFEFRISHHSVFAPHRITSREESYETQ
jgi:hypothetical protein